MAASSTKQNDAAEFVDRENRRHRSEGGQDLLHTPQSNRHDRRGSGHAIYEGRQRLQIDLRSPLHANTTFRSPDLDRRRTRRQQRDFNENKDRFAFPKLPVHAYNKAKEKSRSKRRLHLESNISSPSESETSGKSDSWADRVEKDEEDTEKATKDLSEFSKKFSPAAGSFEDDLTVLVRRQRQIDLAKNNLSYKLYRKYVPLDDRKSGSFPVTPSKFKKTSRRGFDSQIKQWKLNLAKWDAEERSELGDSLETSSTSDSAFSSSTCASNMTSPAVTVSDFGLSPGIMVTPGENASKQAAPPTKDDDESSMCADLMNFALTEKVASVDEME